MAARRRLGVQDALWLEMDRPTNLMVVDTVVWTETPVDWRRMRRVARQRLWDRYPAFRSVAVRGDDGAWYWEDRGDADFDDHVAELTLPEPGDDAALQDFVGSQRTVPLDRDRPLWQMFLVDNYQGGSAVVTRSHHAIADGIRMVQLAMSLFDATARGGTPPSPRVRLHAEREGEPSEAVDPLTAGATAVAKELVELTGDVAERIGEAMIDPIGTATARLSELGDAARAAAATSRGLATTAVTNPLGAAHTAAAMTADALDSAAGWLRSAMWPRLPGQGPLVDAFSAVPGDVDFARKLLLGTRNDTAIWTGAVGHDKAVAWSSPLPLADIKAVAKQHDVTVNDVLVTSAALTLHAYLQRHDSRAASANFMIPVNLKPLDESLPAELGNSFALVQLELPTNESDPLAVLDVVRRRMGRIKAGHEAALAFVTQEVISGLNKRLYRASVDLLASRATGVLTNVPGPPKAVYLAGEKVAGMVGWAPLSGNIPMSFTIYSYDGKVFVGIACDRELVPDHEQIVDGFEAEFRRLEIAER
jgi:diacylglycerol O-acyltransferase